MVKAFLLTKLGRLEDAERIYWTLVDRNPDNTKYYKQIEQCRQLNDTNNRDKLVELYEGIITQRPKAQIPKLLYLNYLEGAAFEEKIKANLIASFRKGIPSLFKNLIFLYANPQKVSKLLRQ